MFDHNKLVTILANTLKLSPTEINEDASIDTLEAWDSLATINLVIAVEAGFNVTLTADDVANFTSFKNICGILQKYV